MVDKYDIDIVIGLTKRVCGQLFLLSSLLSISQRNRECMALFAKNDHASHLKLSTKRPGGSDMEPAVVDLVIQYPMLLCNNINSCRQNMENCTN